MYDGMKAWIDFEYKREEKAGNPYLVNGGFHFADWLALDNPNPGPLGATDPLYIVSAYYYRCAKIVSESARIIGKPEDADKYDKLAEKILSEIQKKYFDENGICKISTQTASVLALAFGLSPAGKKAEAKKLDQKIEENNGHLNTGFVGTPIALSGIVRFRISFQGGILIVK
jgi:alpha-L-rhamnosidase